MCILSSLSLRWDTSQQRVCRGTNMQRAATVACNMCGIISQGRGLSQRKLQHQSGIWGGILNCHKAVNRPVGWSKLGEGADVHGARKTSPVTGQRGCHSHVERDLTMELFRCHQLLHRETGLSPIHYSVRSCHGWLRRTKNCGNCNW